MLRILRRPETEEATGLSKSMLDLLEKRGEFPRRVRISARATGWRSDEVEAWIESRPRADQNDADNAEKLRDIGAEARARGGSMRAERLRAASEEGAA